MILVFSVGGFFMDLLFGYETQISNQIHPTDRIDIKVKCEGLEGSDTDGYVTISYGSLKTITHKGSEILFKIEDSCDFLYQRRRRFFPLEVAISIQLIGAPEIIRKIIIKKINLCSRRESVIYFLKRGMADPEKLDASERERYIIETGVIPLKE